MGIKTITLIQPRHIYAPNYNNNRYGHIYMPTSLLSVASILIEAGINVEIIDENIDEYTIQNNIIGLNLLGAPYIPNAIRYKKRLERKYAAHVLLLGGQIINGFSRQEINLLFGADAYNGNDHPTLADILGVDLARLIKVENTSLVPAYELLSDDYLKLYLSVVAPTVIPSMIPSHSNARRSEG